MLKTYILFTFLLMCILPLNVVAQLSPDSNRLIMTETGYIADGQKDFDFEIGVWNTHLKRLKSPLSGSNAWVTYNGITTVRKVLNGKANLVELDVKGSLGKIQGMSLRLYNPLTKQWSLHFANIADGQLTIPAVGSFHDGVGEFYNEDTFRGKKILIRFIISKIKKKSCHFEQSFSADNGKTWEINWIADDIRTKAGNK